MIIPRNILESLISHARVEAPVEACGYLAGVDNRAVADFPMSNIEGRADHFSFDPAEQFTVHKAARNAGLRIIGVYHSHPETPARPSAEDIRLAYDTEPLYVIISLAGTEPSVKGFRIRQGAVEEEELIIEENL